MTGLQGIIFDLDGVLVFTDTMHYKAWKAVAEQIGAPFDETVNHRLRGVSRLESFEIILENAGIALSQEEKTRLLEEKNALYRAYLSELTPASVDAETIHTLCTLRDSGFKLAIGSSSKNAPQILANTGLAHYFDAVSDGNNITQTKPHPEVFLKAAAFLGLAPHACAVVEDAWAGIDAAKAGGFLAIGIGHAAEYAQTDIKLPALSSLVGCVGSGSYVNRNND